MTDPQTTNHYGIWVHSEVPIIGVVNANAAEWLADDIRYNSINLTYDEALAEYERDPQAWLDEYGFDESPDEFEFGDHWEDNGSETYLVGGWRILNDDGQYEPDLDSEYSAIVGEIYAQVVHSQFVERCALCSPCYPGQGDIGNEGEFLTYTLPLSLWGEFIEEEHKARIRIETALYWLGELNRSIEGFLQSKVTARFLKSLTKRIEEVTAKLA